MKSQGKTCEILQMIFAIRNLTIGQGKSNRNVDNLELITHSNTLTHSINFISCNGAWKYQKHEESGEKFESSNNSWY